MSRDWAENAKMIKRGFSIEDCCMWTDSFTNTCMSQSTSNLAGVIDSFGCAWHWSQEMRMVRNPELSNTTYTMTSVTLTFPPLKMKMCSWCDSIDFTNLDRKPPIWWRWIERDWMGMNKREKNRNWWWNDWKNLLEIGSGKTYILETPKGGKTERIGWSEW